MKFEAPEITVETFCVEDILTTSDNLGDNMTEWG